jgi:hypothetical protein
MVTMPLQQVHWSAVLVLLRLVCIATSAVILRLAQLARPATRELLAQPVRLDTTHRVLVL